MRASLPEAHVTRDSACGAIHAHGRKQQQGHFHEQPANARQHEKTAPVPERVNQRFRVCCIDMPIVLMQENKHRCNRKTTRNNKSIWY